MTPKAQTAFDAWYQPILYPSSMTKDMESAFWAGFYAGVTFAIAETEVSCDCQAGDAGSTPDGSIVTADTIYAAYPRKVGKQAAIKIIKRLTFNNISPAWLLERTLAYAKATESWSQEDKKYIPHPATWFNRGSYDDDPKEWERNSAPASQFSVSH
jgi:hypothetical protein